MRQRGPLAFPLVRRGSASVESVLTVNSARGRVRRAKQAGLLTGQTAATRRGRTERG